MLLPATTRREVRAAGGVARSIHAERVAFSKLDHAPGGGWSRARRRGAALRLVVLRVSRAGAITGGACCPGCRAFLAGVGPAINLAAVYEGTREASGPGGGCHGAATALG